MALFKCKMCGGSLEIAADTTVIECEYCGTQQTLPKLDDDRRANMYDRANHFRRNNEFDKAMGIYENILNEDNTDAEAYWSLILCRYGIEYVEDPVSHKRIPTINRAQFTSIFDDDNYKSALQYADSYQRTIYEEEAKAINEIQKSILSISQKEEPFDVFICYKESDNNGRRTPDSVLAQDLYYQLKQEGFKVFFSRITLEDKLGSAYEPYIFAALNSAKVMVVLGTKPEFFNAVWVKNEWSRYLALVKQGQKKMLIPAYKDMDPYDLPEEFSHLQAQDMSKLGFMQDLIRGIKKIAQADTLKTTVVKETVLTTNSNTNIAPLLERSFMFLEDGDWNSANEYCEKVLDQDPKNAQAYLGKLMAELHVKKEEDLKDQAEPFDKNGNYKKAVRFADEKLKTALTDCIEHIKARNERARVEGIYGKATEMMAKATDEEAYIAAEKLLLSIGEFEDAAALAQDCLTKATGCVYTKAKNIMASAKYEASYLEAANLFEAISEYKDAAALARSCYEKAKAAKKEEEKKAKEERIAKLRGEIINIIHDNRDKERSANTVIFRALPPVWQLIGCGLWIFGITIVLAIAFTLLICLICPFVMLVNYFRYKWKTNRKINYFLQSCDWNYSSDEISAAIASAKRSVKVSKSLIIAITAIVTMLALVIAFFVNAENEKANNYKNAVAMMEAGNYEEAYNAFIAMGDYKDSAELATEVFNKAREAILPALREAEVGDYVTFGKYEQDNNESNGTENIEWLVLAKEDNRILVISKYALAHNIYHQNLADITWEKCSLRNWLNGSGFLDIAFSAAEKSLIPTVTVSADKNPEYNTNPGNATQDKIFLLSVPEAGQYFASDAAMACNPTAYALAKGVKIYGDQCAWWLRTPGINQHTAAYVLRGVYHHGSASTAYNDDGIAVRPALWIDISNVD